VQPVQSPVRQCRTPKTPQATKVRIISAALGSIMTAQSKA
jgi:hypothetical protein